MDVDLDYDVHSEPLVAPQISHALFGKIEPGLKLYGANEPRKDGSFTSVCLFPWTFDDFKILWGGRLPAQTGDEGEQNWARLVEQFSDVALLGGMGTMTVCSTLRRKFRSVTAFEKPGKQPIQPVLALGWALRQDNPFAPLAVFSLGSYTLILDIMSQDPKTRISCLRGHGGLIHAIAVHPTEPHLFCSTSRDFTVRIYNLHLQAANDKSDVERNPRWSVHEQWSSKGGAPHGLRASEPEGYVALAADKKGKKTKPEAPRGRCVKVLVGSRAAGHQQAVLCAAWHPTLPLIATGGLDRMVKIWRTARLPEDGNMAREDKPLFSCVELHRAGVMSIAWVGEDTLVTHDRPAIMDSEGTYELGAVALWKWSSLRRFFPLGQEKGWYEQADTPGVAADFLESSSFEIIARMDLSRSRSALGAKVYNHRYLYPLLAIPLRRSVRLMILDELPPYDRRRAVPLLDGEEDAAIVNGMGNLDIAGVGSPPRETDEVVSEDKTTLIAVDLALTGRLVVAVDVDGRAWVWVGSCGFAQP